MKILLALLIALCLLQSRYASSQVVGLAATIDPDTFPTGQRAALQRFADLTTAAVNGMIPGLPYGYAQTTIVVFQETPVFQRANNTSVPITLVGQKLPGEPSSTKAGTIRIGLVGVEGPDVKRFVFQLSHELTHVKMGANISNTLMKTLAASISYELLVRMQFVDYLVGFTTPEVMKLPPEMQKAYADSNFTALRPYWQNHCAVPWNHTGDISCQVVGTYLLREHQPDAAIYLDIARYTVPLPVSKGVGVQIRPPDVPALKKAGFPVELLGYRP